ncbi:Protein of unknown function, partial [Gryllus bimaculatus]
HKAKFPTWTIALQGLKWAEVSTVRAMGPELVALLPERHLSALPAVAAADLLRVRPDAAGLAAGLSHAFTRDPARRREFLERVSGASLGARVEALLGTWAANSAPNDTAYEELALLRRAGSGLLASLPAARLLAMPEERAQAYVFSLREVVVVRARGGVWRVAPRAPAAVEARLAQNGFLLEGAAPGDVATLPAGSEAWEALAQLSPPPLTARALLPSPKSTPPPPLNISLRLAPAALAQMAPSKLLREAWTPAGAGRSARPPRRRWGLHAPPRCLLALSAEGAPAAAGALAWALPPAQRAQLRAPSPAALTHRLAALLARREAREGGHSAAAGGAWLQARGLLRGLRAGELLRLLPEPLPQPLLLHLLSAFPGDATAPLALALLAR